MLWIALFILQETSVSLQLVVTSKSRCLYSCKYRTTVAQRMIHQQWRKM